MSLELVADAGIEPITKDEQKRHMRVDLTDEDAEIEIYITAARKEIEKLTGTHMIEQSYRLWLDNFPACNTIYIPIGPVIAIDSITYFDENDTESTFSATSYVTDVISIPGRIKLKSSGSWPTTTLRVLNGVKISFDTGFGDSASTVPQNLRHAVRLLAAHYFENREAFIYKSIHELPMGVASLIAKYKMWQRAM